MKSKHCRALNRKTFCEISVHFIQIQWEQSMRANSIQCDSGFEKKIIMFKNPITVSFRENIERALLVRIFLHLSQSQQSVQKRVFFHLQLFSGAIMLFTSRTSCQLLVHTIFIFRMYWDNLETDSRKLEVFLQILLVAVSGVLEMLRILIIYEQKNSVIFFWSGSLVASS